MLYRKLGKTNQEVSILGFGAMRLPVIDDEDARIDEEKAIPMVRHAIDQGVNYLDTAWPYHGGNSELFCAKVMQDGYREKVQIATKLPSWDITSHQDMDRILDEQLKKLQVECIDFYLIHALCEEFWKQVKENDFSSFLNRAKKEGKIRFAGFSFHSDIDLFKEIIHAYDWDFCQIQLNYLDDNYQAGIEGMRYAAEREIGVIVMEPLRGGMLARRDVPETVAQIWAETPVQRTPAEWALRYVWDFPEVSLVLSGMSSIAEVDENIRTADTAVANSLTAVELTSIRKVQDFYKNRIAVNCTQCRYCMPCPAGVNIPEHFWAYNHDALFDDFGKAHFWVTGWLKEHERASNCTECGVCEEHCPQDIPIRETLKAITKKYVQS